MGLNSFLLIFLTNIIFNGGSFPSDHLHSDAIFLFTLDANDNVTNIKSISGTTGTTYQYDVLNRLVHVEDGQGMSADYTYDPLGRRLLKKVNRGGAVEKVRYVWDGWQVIEERDGSGNLTARYTYGNGLDEPVEIERKDPATGQLRSYVPLQDTNGNVLGMADADGNLIEKVSYTPYGGATFIYDHEAPKVDGVRVAEGNVRIRFSEVVTEESAREAINIKQGVTALSGSIAFAEEGRLALFTPSSPLPQNELLTISISTDLTDLLGNKLASAFSQDFTYTGVDLVVYDRVAPEVEKIIYESGKFKVEFAEEIDAASIANSVELKSGNVTIGGACSIQGEKVVVFTPNQTLNSGSVNIKPVIRDLAGKTTAAFNVDYDLSSGDNLIYERPKENEHTQSYIKNTTLFQGRELDYETGLYYFRNRHFNPELGRFMQADPLGYHDSMNLYQAMGNNPVNFTDPMGTDLILGKNDAYEKFAKKLNKIVGDFFNFSKYSTDPATRSFGYTAEYLLKLPENAEVAFESAITGTMGVGIVSAPLGSAQLRFKVLNAIEESAAARKTSTIGVYLAKDEQINAKLIFSELPEPYAGVKQASKYLRDLGLSRADRVEILQSSEAELIKLRVAGKYTFGSRFFGGKSKPLGPYLFETFGNDINRSGLALPTKWNAMTGIIQWQVKPETIFIEGSVAPQFKFGSQYVGGAKQWWIPNPWVNLLKVK